MIFKQIEAILNGTKTQTRRVRKDTEGAVASLSFNDDYVRVYSLGKRSFVKWQVGKSYAIVPKRGAAGVWISPDGKMRHPVTYTHDMEWDTTLRHDARGWLRELGYRPAKIRLTAIRCEHLHDITEQDARAEGVASVDEYKVLWESINGRTKGARWADNPEVWVLEFELAKE